MGGLPDRSSWFKGRNQAPLKQVDFFDQFQHDFTTLEGWSSPEFSKNIIESELRFATGNTEVSAFAKTLERAIRESETTEQKDMVHRFAMTLEKKQRSFFTRARMFTEHRLNHYLADTGIRVHVPPMRNRTLEIHGDGLETTEKRDELISQYIKDLSLARFREIQWEPKFDGKPIESTRIYSSGDDAFIVVRERGPNSSFNYHY